MRKWILWIPVLMVGSMVYWTVALNFGGLSALALYTCVASSSSDEASDLRDSYQPITVQIPGNEEANAATDDDDAVIVDVVSDPVRSDQRRASDLQGKPDTGPGETAF